MHRTPAGSSCSPSGRGLQLKRNVDDRHNGGTIYVPWFRSMVRARCYLRSEISTAYTTVNVNRACIRSRSLAPPDHHKHDLPGESSVPLRATWSRLSYSRITRLPARITSTATRAATSTYVWPFSAGGNPKDSYATLITCYRKA